MIHRAPDTGLETKVDLVPFGAIAGPDGEQAWPLDGSQVMRVLGYALALSAAIHLLLAGEPLLAPQVKAGIVGALLRTTLLAPLGLGWVLKR